MGTREHPTHRDAAVVAALREVVRRAPVVRVFPPTEEPQDDAGPTRGVGLAATQIGEALSLFVIDVASDNEPSDLRVFINPEILETSGCLDWQEGCLSFPGVTEEVERAAKVKVRAQDRDGVSFELEAEGLLAVAIQHEFDHLQGVLMIDHLGALKKRIVHRKMQKRADSETTP